MANSPKQPETPDFDTVYQALCDGDIAFLEKFGSVSGFPHGIDDFGGRYWLTNAITSANLSSVKWVVSKGVELNYKDDEGRSALTAALQKETDFRWFDPDGSGPLTGQDYTISVIDVLIAAGADPNQRLTLDETALHDAAMWSSPRVVRHLLEKGADPFAVSHDSQLPVDIAKFQKRWEVHAILCEAMGLKPSGRPI